jgi:hypothetical protein
VNAALPSEMGAENTILREFQNARAAGVPAEEAARIAVPDAVTPVPGCPRWAVIASWVGHGSTFELICADDDDDIAAARATAWAAEHPGVECCLFRSVESFRAEMDVNRRLLP